MADIQRILRLVQATLAVPPDADMYARWLEGETALAFLTRTAVGDIPLYISGPSFFLYSVLVPRERLAGSYPRDLVNWNFGPPSGWGYGVRYTETASGRVEQPEVFPPLGSTSTAILEGAEPLLFLRFFEGRNKNHSYLELNQKFAHIAGIHWMEERSSYCNLDQNGDMVDVVAVAKSTNWNVAVADSSLLNLYMFLTDQVLIRVFEITLALHQNGMETGKIDEELLEFPDISIFARKLSFGSRAQRGVILRGAQVVDISESQDRLMKLVQGEALEKAKYESFVIHDWKHQEVKEWSCDPAQLGNYFVPSDLPYETSPAFFRPEVLLKYKQDPDRYTLTESSITCRGAWSLTIYDFNDYGQVFTYIVYLGNLPHAEQIYWKSFNVQPKASLPARVIARDFEGRWEIDPDPLVEFKLLLKGFPQARHRGRKVDIWSLGDRDTDKFLNQLNYVVSESRKEWFDEILQLAKIVVEGIQSPVIRDLAKALGCYNEKLGSIRLLQECLTAQGVDDEVVKEVCEPLAMLWNLRSRTAAHLGDDAPVHNLRADYRQRLDVVSNAMKKFSELVEGGILDIPSSEMS